MNFDNKKLGIIGLGYVGLPLAIEFGKKLPVIGFDINIKRISLLEPKIPRDKLFLVHKLVLSNPQKKIRQDFKTSCMMEVFHEKA